MNEPMQLTLEQQFSLRAFRTQVAMMSHEQAQEFLKALYAQMLYRENCYKQLLRHDWSAIPSAQIPPAAEP